MSQTQETSPQPSVPHENAHRKGPAPRWVAIIGALVFGVLFAALPQRVTLGLNWLPLALEVLVILALVAIHFVHGPVSHKTTRIFSLLLLVVVTIALVCSVALLIVTLPTVNEQGGGSLLRTGVLLWLCNIVVFGLWYWEIDGGGPLARHLAGHQAADFLFPQQAIGNTGGWAPHFVDYLFLAFTGATALSPTDTYPLTRRAKALMMLEAIIALIVLAILIGRAVNIL